MLNGWAGRPVSNTRLAGALAAAVLIAAFTTGARLPARPQSAGSAPPQAVAQQFHHALDLAQHGNPQGAMQAVEGILEKYPRYAPALKLKGMLLEDAGQSAEAGAAFEEALRYAPNDPDLLFETGVYKLQTAKNEEALKLLEHCAKLQPRDGDTFFYLAQAYHLNGHDDEAIRAITRSAQLEPDNATVWQKYGELLCTGSDCAQGLRWLEKAQQMSAKLPGLDYDIGAADYKLMDLAGAKQSLTRAVAAQPDDLNALDLLAAVEIKLSNWQAAKDHYARLLTFKPNDADILLALGHCQLELKDHVAAVDTMQQVLRLDPERFLAHFYLSRAYAAMGKAQEAQHEAALHQLMMSQATFVGSSESEARESAIIDQARKLLAQHRKDEARQLYLDRFKGTTARVADSYVFVGKLELYMGDSTEGLEDLHQSLELDSHVHGAHTYLGIYELKLGDLNRAETEFQAELTNDPSYQTAIAEMGEVRYHQQRWQETANYLAKSKTVTPELIFMLCDAYFHLNRQSDADLNAEAAAVYGRNDKRFMQGLIDLLRRNGQTELAGRLTAGATP